MKKCTDEELNRRYAVAMFVIGFIVWFGMLITMILS